MRAHSLLLLATPLLLLSGHGRLLGAEVPAKYVLFDLGEGDAVGVSDDGTVAANSGGFPSSASRRSVLPGGAIATQQVLGIAGGDITLRGMAPDGTVVGVSKFHACKASPGDVATSSIQAVAVDATATGGSEAWDINSSGTTVGAYSVVGNVTYQGSPATFAGGAPTKLSTQLGVARAVNAAGKIVGRSAVGEAGAGAQGRVILWSQGGEYDLTADGSVYAQANDINDGDQIVGFRSMASSVPGPGHRQAFLFDLTAGTDVDLGFLPGGRDSEALAINEFGVVVGHASVQGGFSTPEGDFTGRAVAWYDGQTIVDLNSLVDPDSAAIAAATLADPKARYLLEAAVGINAAGDIACSGTLYDGADVGTPHVLLLRPQANGLVVTPVPVDFGKVVIGKSSQRTVTIRNASPDTVRLKLVKPGFPFKAAGPKKLTLEAGESKTVKITATPRIDETFSSELRVVNGSVTIPVNVVVHGVDDSVAIEVSPSQVDFGEVDIYDPLTRTVTLTNRSDVAMRVKVAAPAKPFSVAAKTLQIAPNGTANLDVQCAYAGFGDYDGKFTVTPDVKDAKSTSVALKGKGVFAVKIVSATDGRKVEAARNRGGYAPAEVGTYIRKGDRIHTGYKAGAIIQFPNGSIVLVGSMTLIELDDIDATHVNVLVKLGEIKAQINKMGVSAGDFQVQTPTSTASVRGTKFSVLHDNVAGLSVVSVTEHSVDVTPATGVAVNVLEGLEVESTATTVGPLAKIGLAGTPVGSVGRSVARDFVLKILAKAEVSCGLVARDSDVGMVQKPDGAPGWDVTVTTNRGVSHWEVDRRYVKPVDAAAQEIYDRCK